MVDQVRVGNKIRKDEGGFLETLKVIAQALLIAVVVRTLLFQTFNIPSGSLIPTLLIGDYLFVSKFAYGYSYASCPSVRIAAVGLDLGADDFCGWAEGRGRLWAGQPARGEDRDRADTAQQGERGAAGGADRVRPERIGRGSGQGATRSAGGATGRPCRRRNWKA